MSISIRPASLPQDYGDIADVLRDESADWAATADELAHEDTERDPRSHQATFVAEELGAAESLMVGVGFVGHDTMAHQAGRFVVNLRVRQAWQGRGGEPPQLAARRLLHRRERWRVSWLLAPD